MGDKTSLVRGYLSVPLTALDDGNAKKKKCVWNRTELFCLGLYQRSDELGTRPGFTKHLQTHPGYVLRQMMMG